MCFVVVVAVVIFTRELTLYNRMNEVFNNSVLCILFMLLLFLHKDEKTVNVILSAYVCVRVFG